MSQSTVQTTDSLPPGDREALEHFRGALQTGQPWPYALLEAVALWASPEEVCQDRHYLYLIDGEAFDWLLLAERLCTEVDGLIPQEEKEALLFHGRFPQEIPAEEFKKLLGPAKHTGHLNYHYGVIVEEALLLAVEEEVRKARLSKGYAERGDYSAEAYQRLYRESRKALLERFLKEKGYPSATSLTYSQYREFTYWLFKRRLKTSDPAKVASDTRKGLDMLEGLRGEGHPGDLLS